MPVPAIGVTDSAVANRTPRLVIAGTHSGVGKTTIATALLAAFTRRGLRVQPFKIGPDFIDPGFHLAASRRASRNLDGWMLSHETNLQIFGRACADADLAVIEGVMGLFDGQSATSEEGSTAEMAKWLGAPVLLVVNASAMARSAAALLRGFEEFDRQVDVAGVLFNRVGSEGHVDLLREAVMSRCRATPFGFLPRNPEINMPERHLGLVTANESLTTERLEALADWIEKHADLDGLLRLTNERAREISIRPRVAAPAQSRVRIGVARDAAFCFYYQDNLDLLAENGAELVEFSPIVDEALPQDLDGLYLGGGYREIYAAKLSANRAMQDAVRQFAHCRGQRCHT